MHFDDRLATVLRQPAAGGALARIQFRQLLDLLGSAPSEARGETSDAAFLRLAELGRTIPAERRAAILGDPGLRLRNPRLVAELAAAEPEVAVAAIARADLGEEQWLDLVPALPLTARGVLRHRRGLSPSVDALLDRLGIMDRGLPPADTRDTGTPASPESPPDGIAAIVRRIEAYRRARQQETAPTASAPAESAPARPPAAIDFATDAEGRFAWADAAVAPMVIGLRLAGGDSDAPLQGPPELAAAFRRRQPVRGLAVQVRGAPAIEGTWQLDAAPRFAGPAGAFAGYRGRLRRPAGPAEADGHRPSAEGDRMRQVLHELKTPVNAIQGFSEAIQQQLFGPTPHEYRALAAAIAGDAARILAGFDELERLVKLDAGALALDPGACDLAGIVARTVARLEAVIGARGSGFDAEVEPDAPSAALDAADAEQLVWRLLATLAGSAATGERLRLRLGREHEMLRLTVGLPAALAARDDEALFHAGPPAQGAALIAGMFGTGFALRLATAEARAAGGTLERDDDKLRLALPIAADGAGLTGGEAGHSHDASGTGPATG